MSRNQLFILMVLLIPVEATATALTCSTTGLVMAGSAYPKLVSYKMAGQQQFNIIFDRSSLVVVSSGLGFDRFSCAQKKAAHLTFECQGKGHHTASFNMEHNTLTRTETFSDGLAISAWADCSIIDE